VARAVIGLPEIAVLCACAIAGWLVWDTMKARETANDAMRTACERSGYYFLDDTVSLKSVRPMRDHDGRMRLSRVYIFQYSDTGLNRRDGSITLLANAVTALTLAPNSPPPPDARAS
jgi:hypothetical protein